MSNDPGKIDMAVATTAEALAKMLGAALVVVLHPEAGGIGLHISSRLSPAVPDGSAMEKAMWEFITRSVASIRQHASEVIAVDGEVERFASVSPPAGMAKG